jgi:hypothetical protein
MSYKTSSIASLKGAIVNEANPTLATVTETTVSQKDLKHKNIP